MPRGGARVGAGRKKSNGEIKQESDAGIKEIKRGESKEEIKGLEWLEPSLGWRGEVRRLRELMVEKDEEIARLKRELAEANRLEPMTSGLSPEAHTREVVRRRGGRPDNDKQVTPHGGRCACLACRAGR